MADKKAGPTADDIMSSAEMKPLLTKSKQEPVSCAIGLTKTKEGVVLLDIKLKPKQLAAELKKRAAKAKLELDATTLRFGRAHVDTEQEAGLVKFVVNKDAGGAMRGKLLEHLRKAGFGKVEIVVDGGLDAEPEEAGAPEAPPPAGPGTAAAAPSPPGGDVGGLTKSLTEMVKRLAQAEPAQQTALKGFAVQAQAALKSGDLAGASASMDKLRSALDGSAPPGAGGGRPASSNGAASAGPDPAAKAAYVKARLAWLAARKKVEGDIGKLQDGLSTAFKGHGKLPDLQSGFKARVEKVLNQLDEQLADKLDEAAKATDGGQHAKLVGEAKQLMQRYEAFIASDPTLKQIDANPFVPLAIEKTLTTTLSVLSRTIV